MIPLALGRLDEFVPGGGRPWTVFPDENADPQDPASYDFRAVDDLVRAAASEADKSESASLAVRIRLAPVEAAASGKIEQAVRRIVMHFNEGWAQGHRLSIREWQLCGLGALANGANGNQALDVYETIADGLRRQDRSLRVGRCIGVRDRPGSTNLARESRSPGRVFDFFSPLFKNLTNDPQDPLRLAQTLRQQLDEEGLPKSEITLADSAFELEGAGGDNSAAAAAAAFLAAALAYLQDAAVESVPIDLWSRATGPLEPKRHAVARAMAQMGDTPQRVSALGGDKIGYAVLAGQSDDRSRVQILIANYQRRPSGLSVAEPAAGAATGSGEPRINPRPDSVFAYADSEGYDLDVSNLPWGAADFGVYRYSIDEERDLDLVWEGGGRGGGLRLRARLPAPGVELIVLQREDRPVSDRLPRRRGRER